MKHFLLSCHENVILPSKQVDPEIFTIFNLMYLDLIYSNAIGNY